MSKITKLFAVLGVLLLGFSVLVGAGTSVYAAEELKEKQEFYSSEEIKQLEADIDFFLNEAAITDVKGNIVDFDFDLVYARYGQLSELMQLEKIIFVTNSQRASAKQCAINAIQDTLGVSAIQGLISGGIVGLLQKKAAAEIAKLVAKYAFKGLLPATAAASLIWSFGRCMWF
ncbi:hypothetical protein [Enterococcus sp. 5B3_DIV0040]|uniref:hypothetical protein n=1 Tax=Enterococcus sp. 5B3_DIV0040 TaxID=1834182 RepID=UPI000A35B53E|nr:hypothetical protein [Enterococcus sp. 5B3_DIV0040]OTO05094.1 hypothetical protein A5883_002084 [Enterococcus sp. 5B3_DIV0040]